VGIPVSDGRLAVSPEEARAAASSLGGPVVVKAPGAYRRPAARRRREARRGPGLTPRPRHGTSSGSTFAATSSASSGSRRASDIATGVLPLDHVRRGSRSRSSFHDAGRRRDRQSPRRTDALIRLHVDPSEGFQPWVARRLIYGAKVDDASEQKQIAAIVERPLRGVRRVRRNALRINPLIVTPDGEVKALDSKFTVDDNALFGHPTSPRCATPPQPTRSRRSHARRA